MTVEVRYYYLCILLISFLRISGQPATLSFINYSTNEGLPSPEVHEIFQDSEGYIWIGTDNGVARFDGYKFSTYGSKNGLGYNVILNILEDKNGRLWFSALNGLIYVYEDGEILPYKFNNVIDQYRKDFVDGQLFNVDEDMSVQVLLTKCGLLTIDSIGKANLLTCRDPHNFLLLHSETYTTSTKCGCLDVHGHEGNQDSTTIEIFDTQRQFIGSFDVQENSSRSSPLYSFQLDPSTTIFGYLGKIYFFRNDSMLWSRDEPELLHDLKMDLSGGIWAGLANSKGVRYYPSVQNFHKNNYYKYLEGHTITDVLFDRDGSLWIGSHESGIYYCVNREIEVYKDFESSQTSLVSAVAIKSAEEIFVGIGDGKVSLLNTKNGSNAILPFTTEGVSNYVYDLYYNSQMDQIWSDEQRIVAGRLETRIFYDRGASRFHAKKYHFDPYRGVLWLIKGQGFISVRPSDGVVYPEVQNVFLKERFFAIYVDKAGTVWTGSNSGLAEWRDNKLIPVIIDHPAFHSRIEDIDAFEGQHLIFGTKGYGVIIWRDGKIIEVNSNDGLASDMIEDVHVDENNIAWIATFNGLSKIILQGEQKPSVRTFTMGNGLPSNEIYQVKSYLGQPWICTGNGLVKWKDQPYDSISYRPQFQGFLVNGKAWQNADLRLQHWQNNINFEYLTIDFQQYGKINYRYRLSKNQPWITTKNTSISYARLSPGNYAFEVQSQNSDGIWSGSTQKSILVLKPWYRTWWFLTASIALSLGITYLLFTWWLRRKVVKEQFEREIQDLKKSALQAQMNPHFIFNCLNSIQSFVNTGQREEANNYLLNFSHLIRGCLNASIEREVTLSQDISFIRNYLDLEKMRFSPEFDYQINIGSGLEVDKIMLEPMLVLPFVENAVIHGLSRADRNGEIQIDYSLSGLWLSVTIKDNGPGLKAAVPKRINPNHKSVGITITKRRLDLINRENVGKVRIVEMIENGKVKGTVVELKISVTRVDDKVPIAVE